MIEEDTREPCPACGEKPDFYYVWAFNNHCEMNGMENDVIPDVGIDYVVTCTNPECPEYHKYLSYGNHPDDCYWKWNHAIRNRKERMSNNEKGYRKYLVHYTVNNLYCAVVDAPNPEVAAKAVKAFYRDEPGIPGSPVVYHECEDEALINYEVREHGNNDLPRDEKLYVFGEEELDG